ncbi:MAG: DUF6789 family protein [Bacteroidota bacterium]
MATKKIAWSAALLRGRKAAVESNVSDGSMCRQKVESLGRLLLKGAAAGLVATAPMTLLMVAWHRRLPFTQRYPLPPSLIAKRLAYGTQIPDGLMPRPNPWAMLAAHSAFGAATGALFGATHIQLQRQHPVATGIGYGLFVWAASYLGWVPLGRFMLPATRQPPARNAMMIAAHIVWGATLGLVLDTLSKGSGQPGLNRKHRAGGQFSELSRREDL